MTDFEEYARQGEPPRRARGYAWRTAIGLQAVDGLRPSDYLVETARKHIDGDITIDEARALIGSYYKSKSVRTQKERETEEADKVAANMAAPLGERTLAFSLAGLVATHRRLFDGVFEFAGRIRDYNITKSEWVLRGGTVLYVSAPDIRAAIEHDLERERVFDYTALDINQIVAHVARFASDLWQIHPFGEGNTRTTAVFIIKYLRSLGFNVENDAFADNAWYFRNALVRANYQDIKSGVKSEPRFLELFFRNLLMDERNELRNRYMLIGAPSGLIPPPTSRPTSSPTNSPTNSPAAGNANVAKLIEAIGDKSLSVKEMMAAMGLRDRGNFVSRSLTPAVSGGLVEMLHPDHPRHPRQKYRLTDAGKSLLRGARGR